MTETNVIVINSDVVVSTLAFEHASSLVSFIAAYLDDHDSWAEPFELILVHRNSKVLRFRGRGLQDLVALAYGIQVAGWLLADDGDAPTMNYMDWLKEDNVTKVFDSSTDPEDGFNEDPYT